MTFLFALVRRTLAAAVLVVLAAAPVLAQTATPVPSAPANDNGTLPAGGKFKECHGYVRHVSDLNMKVHCIDGNASDQSFLYLPKYAKLKDGKSVQTTKLTPDTPVHVIYTQSLGIKKAYEIYVADPEGHGVYGFRS